MKKLLFLLIPFACSCAMGQAPGIAPSPQKPTPPTSSSPTSSSPLQAVEQAVATQNVTAIVQACSRFTHSTPLFCTQVAEMGRQITIANAAVIKAQQAQQQITVETTRLRSNASVTERPSSLRPNDNSGQSRAAEMRARASALETDGKAKNKEAQETLKSNIAALGQLVVRISAADKGGASESASGPASGVKNDAAAERALKNEAIVEKALKDPPDFTITPAGPEIHGFRLGMTYDDFLENLKLLAPEDLTRYPGSVMDVTDLSDKPGLARQKMQCVVFRNREQGPLVDVGIAGRPAVVVTFTLFSPMLERLFKCRLMSFRDFCQSFIDGYQIPELKKSENSSSMNYQSSDGWKVVLGTRTGNDKTVLLYATPTKIDQGFGQ